MDERTNQSFDATSDSKINLSTFATQDNQWIKETEKVKTPSERVYYLLQNNKNDDKGQSHPLFSQMSTLRVIQNGQFEWRQSARWVKFEEDVEEGGQRWSKPYVASLSLHYLFDLRSVLQNGTVVLDLQASNPPQIADVITENMINDGRLPRAAKDAVRHVLMSQHKHLYQVQKHKLSQSNNTKLPSINDDNQAHVKRKGNKRFMKKLPMDAETANILVGETSFLESPVYAFVRLAEATHLENFTEVNVPTRFLFIILGSKGGETRFHEIGRAMGTLLSDEVFRDVVYKVKDKKDLMSGVDEFMDSVTVLPPGEWDPAIRIEPPLNVPSQEPRKSPYSAEAVDEEAEERRLREEAGLVRTNRLFGGLTNDIKRKAPWYWSDFKDALSTQSVSTICFLYFACLTPIITFGGLLGEATGNNIAALESLVSGLICGVFYGLFAGQPLTILGSTGPVLVFETIVYDFCQNMDWNYLELRLWIGLWVAFILVILVAFDASSFVCYITRFTEENFATLIALIFIIKAVEKVFEIGHYYPMASLSNMSQICECNSSYESDTEVLNLVLEDGNLTLNQTDSNGWQDIDGSLSDESCMAYYPDVFMLSIVLFCGTFMISTSLKDFKTAPFFPTWVRNFLSDFAVIIGIASMTLLDVGIGIQTPKLLVPENFKPTNPNRGWVVSPFGQNPWWTPLAASFPALLACILLFMDQQITSVIINRKEHKLKKGGGYHLDLFVLAILIAVNSILGLPWFVAATVLAINHVNSLKLESETSAPGEKPQFLGVRENRVTQIIIFLLIGSSVFITSILKKIPMAVLFGVFLYMGIAALHGSQFFDRVKLIFMPAKYQPDYAYLRDVPINRVHLFTCIQLSCLAGLWIIKSFSQTSILFPLMLVVMIGVRKGLDKIFTQRELKILDDGLPEFKRKQKLKELDDEIKKQNLKEEGMTIISLKTGTIRKVINISNELDKSGIWSQVTHDKNLTSSMSPVNMKSRPINGVGNAAFVIDENVDDDSNDEVEISIEIPRNMENNNSKVNNKENKTEPLRNISEKHDDNNFSIQL